MKHFFPILTLGLVVFYTAIGSAYGQKNDPLFFLNSKQMDLHKVYLNPMRIDSLRVDKQTQFGEIHAFTKNREFSFYNLTDILKKYTDLSGSKDPIIFRISGKLVEDTSSIMIDDTYFVYVDVEKLDNIKYISKQLRNLKMVNIGLEREKRVPVMLRKGNDAILEKLNQ